MHCFFIYCRYIVRDRAGRGAVEAHPRFLRLFRSLSLLIDEFSRVFVMIYGSGHVGIIVISLFCAYGTIRFDGALSVSLGWMGANVIIFLSVLICQFGSTNHSSKLTLKAIRREQEQLYCMGNRAQSNWLRREIRCLRDLQLRVGSVFFYDKILLFTTLQILLQNITNLLLLH